jgi:hypothetical protein
MKTKKNNCDRHRIVASASTSTSKSKYILSILMYVHVFYRIVAILEDMFWMFQKFGNSSRTSLPGTCESIRLQLFSLRVAPSLTACKARYQNNMTLHKRIIAEIALESLDIDSIKIYQNIIYYIYIIYIYILYSKMIQIWQTLVPYN